MKKISFLLAVLLTIGISANAKKPKPELKSSIEITSNHSDRGKKISFNWFASEYLPMISYFKCINNTDERIYIEWEHARMGGNDKVVFGTDSQLTMNSTKSDEAVSPRSTSIERNLTSSFYMSYPILTNGGCVFNYKNIKKKKNIGNKEVRYLKIPIKFADNTIEEYEITLTAWYELQSN